MAEHLNKALILFGHGARDPEWAQPMARVKGMVLAATPAFRVELAFLEFITPNLEDAVARLVGEGVTQIDVLPMFIAQGGHLKAQVPEMLSALARTFPGLQLRLQAPIGESFTVLAAMAEHALEIGRG